MTDLLPTKFQELPKDSKFWDQIDSLGYKNGQFFFPGMDPKKTPLTFESLQKRYHLRTKWTIVNISGSGISNEDKEDIHTPCHKKVILNIIDTTLSDNCLLQKKGHIKSVPILDVIGVMKGSYVPTGMDACLPSRELEKSKTTSKISDPNNQGYVDCITGYILSDLVSKNKCPGFAECYGHFTSLAPKLKVDITDDFYSIRNLAWFHRGLGSRFVIEAIEFDDDLCNPQSGKRSRKITIGDEVFGFTEEMKDIAEAPEIIEQEWENEKIQDLECSEIQEIKVLPGLEHFDILDSESISGLEKINISDSESVSDLEEETDDEIEEESDDEEDYDDGDVTGKFFAIIPDIPIQSSIYQDLCGPIDNLLGDPEVDENQWKSILFQICFNLSVAQKENNFIHNDLHTNNVMWEPTDHKYIWFKVDEVYYRVPTYGKIIKIIDFGRAYIYYEGREYMSDAFDFSNDAGGQYNYPPYYRSDQPDIPPNPSFDLPRLACSIVEGMCDSRDEPETEVLKLLYSWLTDNRGKNILWNKNGEDRFGGFGLYKHISRYCKDSIPHDQLTKPVFEEYIQEDKPGEKELYYEFTKPLDTSYMILKKKELQS